VLVPVLQLALRRGIEHGDEGGQVAGGQPVAGEGVGVELPEEGRLAARAGPGPGVGPLWLAHGPDAPADRVARWAGRGAEPVAVPLGSGGEIDPGRLLAALAARGLGEVLCEGGGTLAAALLSAGLVDELVTFTAGLALGAEGQPGIGALGVHALAEAPRFALVELRAAGPDTMAVWRPL